MNTLLLLEEWMGVAALTERLYAGEYTPPGAPPIEDKSLIEKADFQMLEVKLQRVQIKTELHKLLTAIKNS